MNTLETVKNDVNINFDAMSYDVEDSGKPYQKCYFIYRSNRHQSSGWNIIQEDMIFDVDM